ncbi:MAG TPA: hypothetical protein VFO18_06380 [Methylomirabilota bacterium]|nr:hypothetical protein [Methylomirabilota bacterium]
MPVIPVFGSREPIPSDPRRRQYVLAAVILAAALIGALAIVLVAFGPSSTEQCLAEGGRWDEGLGRCERGEETPQPGPYR